MAQIEILSVAKGKGVSKAGKNYFFTEVAYKDKGKPYTKKLFDNDPILESVSKLKNGDIVDVEQVKEGEFWKWVSVTSSGDSAPAQVYAPGSSDKEGTTRVASSPNKLTYNPGNDDQRQVLIVRQNCVGNAVKRHENDNVDVHTVLKTAALFENYVFGRYTPPKDQKEGFADLEEQSLSDVDDEIPF